jgi:hypothetical protein
MAEGRRTSRRVANAGISEQSSEFQTDRTPASTSFDANSEPIEPSASRWTASSASLSCLDRSFEKCRLTAGALRLLKPARRTLGPQRTHDHAFRPVRV